MGRNIKEILTDLNKDVVECSLLLADTEEKLGLVTLYHKRPVLVSQWTRDGWMQSLICTKRARKMSSLVSRAPYHREEFDIESVNSDLAVFKQISETIQIGSPLSEIDELSNAQKQLVQSPDEWYVDKSSSSMYKKLDPESQAYRGNWGYDTSYQEFSENPVSTLREFLIRCELIIEDCEYESFLAAAIEVCQSNYLPGLIDELEELESLDKNYYRRRKKAETQEQIIELEDYIEEQIDDIFTPYLTYSLNSEMCGYGYSAPASKFEYIYNPKENSFVIAANKRKELFLQLFAEASILSSSAELYGPPLTQKEKEEGKEQTGGFYWKIRDMHQEDKMLVEQWTDQGENSAWALARQDYIERWHKEDRGDQKALDAHLWILFDRQANKKEAVYDALGNKIADVKYYEDSIWRQKRTKAFMTLNLTHKQWVALYSMLSQIKKRIFLNRKTNDIQRNRALNKLRNEFKDINTLDLLTLYVNKAQRRDVKENGEVTFSLIDDISISDEHNWRKACTKKRNKLVKQLMQFNNLEKKIIEITETEGEEQYLSCPHVKCGGMVVGIPKEAVLNTGSKLLFVECEECGNKVWLL